MCAAPPTNAARVTLVAALVLLAGCGVLGGGGGGGGTPTANATAGGPATSGGATPTQVPATTAPAGTATAAPTASNATATPNGTATPTATATPLPPGSETVTVANESLGIELTLTGNQSVIGTPEMADVTGAGVTRDAVLRCARASAFVGVTTNGTVADATVAMSYDPSRLPANASESDLAVFAYNDTVAFYLELSGTVDAENDTVTATGVNATVNEFTRETANGTETLRPSLDGTRLNNVFVVLHWPTFWDGHLSGEVPSQCEGEAEATTGTE
jgi:hypothetical protein